MTRRLVALAACSLVAAWAVPAASAHARFVGSSPEDGAVLGEAPAVVRLLFDDAVRPASGIAAIANRTRASIVRGEPRVEGGRRLVVALRPRLPRGDYTVRWRVRSDDGHTLAGVVAFRVGSGGNRPVAALSADSGPSGRDVLQRWLLVLGIALAAGGLAFHYLVWRPAIEEPEEDGRPRAGDDSGLAGTIVVSGFLLALVGLGLLQGGVETRFDRANALGAVAALVGAVLVAISAFDQRARPFALVPALVLLAVPALRGHALDPGHSRVLAATVDVVHLAAASVWIGGLVQLLATPMAGGAHRERVARRFSAVALIAVAVVGVTGVLRALSELSAVDELWDTGYGRALVAKTAIFAPLVGLGWLNRARLVPALARSSGALARFRLNLGAEAALLLGLLAVVGVLTALRPGRLAERVAAPTERSEPVLPRALPGTLVLAHQDGELAVGLAARLAGDRLELTASVLGPDGLGVDGLAPRLAAGAETRTAVPCGSGCYRVSLRRAPQAHSITIRLLSGERPLAFRLPATLPAPDAAALLRRIERIYHGLRTLVIDEQLESSPRHAISTVYRLVAPDRMAYQIAGGAAGISIGRTRWDRETPTSRWVRSDQEPIPVPRPFWSSASDASVLAAGRSTWTLTFLDRRVPAWFELVVDRGTLRPRTLRMTAAAHFMHHRYGPFNAPIAVEPP